MGLPKVKESWTVAEYFAFEKTSPIRYEYVDGQVYAMSGVSKNHNRIAGNLYVLLIERLAGKGCEPFITDVRVKVSPRVYYYPDVVVTCDPLVEEDEDTYIAESPRLVVEVLSPSNVRTDRTEKMHEYQFTPGLREYVIIEQDYQQLEIYRHDRPGDPWQKAIFTDPDEQVTLASVEVTFRLGDIYRRVRFAETPAESPSEQ
ncbi:MAG: Uma2 family endonuclease [Blastocatellia bacterium]